MNDERSALNALMCNVCGNTVTSCLANEPSEECGAWHSAIVAKLVHSSTYGYSTNPAIAARASSTHGYIPDGHLDPTIPKDEMAGARNRHEKRALAKQQRLAAKQRR